MKKEINFVLTEVSSELSGGRKCFQATAQLNGVMSEEQLDLKTSQRCGVPPENVHMVVTAYGNVTKEALRNGMAVTTPNFQIKPVMVGSYGTVDAEFDPTTNALETRATTRNEMRHCYEGITPVNMVKKPAPVLEQVGDAVTGKVGVLTIDDGVFLAGRNILVDVSLGDEGCWLLKPDTLEVAAIGEVTDTTQQTANVTFEEWPDPGEYVFCLKTRSGCGENFTLVTLKKNVTVVPAENGESEE